MSFFIYNGQSSEDFGLRIERKSIFSAPAFDSELISIPGRNGDLIVPNHRFENVRVTYSVFLARRSIQQLANTIRAVKAWLYTEPDRYHELSDSYDAEYFRYGLISGSLDIEEQLNKIGLFTVTFSCKPFKYSFAGQTELELQSGGSITNPEAFNAKPFITILGTGNIALTLQNGLYNKTWSFADITEGIVCDSEQMNFYYGTQLLNNKVTGDSFPELLPGETTITATGATSIAIKPRWCCI